MFVNFPDLREVVKRMNVDEESTPSAFSLEASLRDFQSKTIMTLAIVMEEVAGQCERRNQTVTPEELRLAAHRLREYASQIEQGEKP